MVGLQSSSHTLTPTHPSLNSYSHVSVWTKNTTFCQLCVCGRCERSPAQSQLGRKVSNSRTASLPPSLLAVSYLRTVLILRKLREAPPQRASIRTPFTLRAGQPGGGGLIKTDQPPGSAPDPPEHREEDCEAHSAFIVARNVWVPTQPDSEQKILGMTSHGDTQCQCLKLSS